MSQGSIAVISSVLVTVAILLFVSHSLSSLVMNLWIAALLIVGFFRLCFIHEIKKRFRTESLSSLQLNHAESIYAGSALVAGGLAGGLGMFLDPESTIGMTFVISFALLGFASAALGTNGSSLKAYYAFVIPVLLPSAYFLYQANFVFLCLLIFIYLIMMVVISIRVNKVMLDGLVLRFENDELIKELRTSNQEQTSLLQISHEQKQNLALLAHYDGLTGLPNRARFAERFQQAVAHSRRNKNMLMICFLDLDNFKQINDNFGHSVGDLVLVEVAARLRKIIREEDTASRQGGDEFTLLIRNVTSFLQCERLLQRLQLALNEPYLIKNRNHKISASIGATLYPADDSDLDTLLRHADQAMYQAKLEGKNKYQLFNTLDNRQLDDKNKKFREIEQALEHNEFQLYYQPKVNMETGVVFGVEALLRWNSPEKGLIQPLEFLPVISGSDLEVKIGTWVVNEAIAQLDIWRKNKIALEVSVNVSSQQLQSEGFFELLYEAFKRYPEINPSDLQLEILESSALDDIDAISDVIKDCQHIFGVNVALDDFGTGYSSLTHMKNLPANTIKIDRGFVRDVLTDPDDYSIIESIIGLANAFNRKVIAEGIESEAQGLALLIMGCKYAQGYEISLPLPVDDLIVWLGTYRPNQQWLSYSKSGLTNQASKIKLLKLTTQDWFEKLNSLLSMPKTDEQGIEIHINACHLAVWLSRFKDQEIFDKDWIDAVEKEHNALFTLAKQALEQHQGKDRTSADVSIELLEEAYQKLIQLF